jgi:membrane-associated phospholipid phosphatase
MIHRHRSVIVPGLLVALFVVLATFAATSATTPGDVWLERRFQSVHSGAFAWTLDYTSNWATDPLATAMIVAGALTAVCIGGARAGVLAALLPVTRLLVPVLKATFERQRPSAVLVHVQGHLADYSFPSGHAFNSMLIYGLFFYLATVYVRPRLLRHLVQAACLWVIVVTPMQRVYVGAHWPSDVLGGMVLAALVLSLGIAAHQWSLRLKRPVVVPTPAPPLASPGRQP